MRLTELLEARRNPELNFDGRLNDRMSSAFGFLSQFKPATGDLPNYFVTFTEIPKVGVNPRSKYQTPIGVYSYPVVPQIIMGHTKKELPFAGDEKYISVLQSAVYDGKILWFDDSDSYINYERDAGKLRRFIEDKYDGQDTEGFLEDAALASYEPRDPQSRIWNQSRWVAAAEASKASLDDVSKVLASGKDVPGIAIKWNYVLRKVLGYELIVDLGTGTIHQNEPLQAVFLSKEGFHLVDQRQNQNSATRGPKHVTMLDFYHMAQDNTINFGQFVGYIDKVLSGHQRAIFRVDKVQYYIDKPVGEEIDVAMKNVARMHLTPTQAANFKVGLRAWMDRPLFRVTSQTREELLVQLIRCTIENHPDRDVESKLRTTLEKFTFTPDEVRAALNLLELDLTV